ncbi:manganese efflux pump MntP [Alicyclobacillus vulcanalis]|uniref:Putative Mn2+ efflux pump MntP n=1 Tax=Alicyclobacillus vulcanalis TaxID=252246 RepID=A0A1N7KB29_9BACL|nr:manganese efflux pump [Alicyclobacillus vulcanalis]SIS58805.1 Putative Mn2+ efflux pump MntP [Alicyclobacillus vulcanalis]
MLTQLLLIGLGIGLDNGLAAIGLGASGLSRRLQWRVAIIFAVFEAWMPVLGIWAGREVASVLGRSAHVVGIAILALLGLYSLFKRRDDDDEIEAVERARGLQIVLLAIALSIDNLTVGFSLGILRAPLALAGAVFGSVSFLLTVAGLEAGRFLAARLEHLPAERLTGLVLLAVAGWMAAMA